MAFGDLIKSDNAIGNLATFAVDLASGPTTGNLLISALANGSSTATLDTAPAGMTLLSNSFSGSGGWAWYYKVSDGTEQTQTVTWSTTARGEHLYVEYEWDGSTPTVTSNEDESNISSATNSQATGAATPAGATNICIAFHSTDGGSNSSGGQAVDGSWVEDFLFTGGHSQQGECKLSRLVSVTGSQNATHSDTDNGDQMYGAIAIFDVAAGGATSNLILLSDHFNGGTQLLVN